MNELLFMDRLLYFAIALGITGVLGVIHGFMMVKKPIIALLIAPIGSSIVLVAMILSQGWSEYASAWFQPETPYITLGSIIGLIFGEIVGLLLGERS